MSVKKIAMIPAHLGSEESINENLRLLGGKPLVWHIVTAIINAKKFKKSDIYINSNSKEIEEIAHDLGVNFYPGSPEYATSKTRKDDCIKDFVSNVDMDVLFQFSPAAPFITSQQIEAFVERMLGENLDTLISVHAQKKECMFNEKPVNYDSSVAKDSRQITPLHAYTHGMMAWHVEQFKENMFLHNSGYHGVDGKTGFFELSGFSTIDIVTEDDFRLAEAAYECIHQPYPLKPQYYNPKLHARITSEADVPSIIDGDGVAQASYTEANQSVRNIQDILKSKESPSWIHRVVNSESNSACLICQQPGEGNRRHYHPRWNEWWLIIQGTWDFEIEGEIKSVKTGDFVFIPKNSWHKITATGDRPAIRLAVSREGVEHVYRSEETKVI